LKSSAGSLTNPPEMDLPHHIATNPKLYTFECKQPAKTIKR
jgi:hypothetical protein